MGPSLFRTEDEISSRHHFRCGRFNGAVLIQDGRLCQRHSVAPSLRASMGPSLFRTEDEVTKGDCNALRLLQWGRPYSGRKTQPLYRPLQPLPPLQWGRPYSGRKTTNTTWITSCWNRFNGAVLIQDGRRSINGWVFDTEPLLQWGRPYSGRKTTQGLQRSFVRHALQWGRPYSGRKTTVVASPRTRCALRFNGAVLIQDGRRDQCHSAPRRRDRFNGAVLIQDGRPLDT